MREFILASASPRRQALVQLLQSPVQVWVADVDEESVTDPDPAVNVVRTACLKAQTIAGQVKQDAIVIAADTTVALEGEMLNKPANLAEARLMLRRLRGRAHMVHTGIALVDCASGQMATTVSSTRVFMRDFGETELERYVASGDPLDKAGAYAIQHPGFRPVARLEGCYTGVVGLPLCKLQEALHELGVEAAMPVATNSHNYQDCSTCLALLDGLL